MSNRRGSKPKVQKAINDSFLKKKAKHGQEKEKNLSLEIKNYQRQTMLNGIDQLEKLDQNHELFKLAQSHGVDPLVVSDFKGKEVLESLRTFKIEYDKQYF